MSYQETFPQGHNQLPTDIADHLYEPATDVAKALHPKELELKVSLADTIDTLHRLPHLAIGNQHLIYPEEKGETEVIEAVDFPMNRIVGVASFDSWAGRGLDASGGAEKVGGYSSAGTIHHYAHNSPAEEYTPTVTLFKDVNGEVWGATMIDGSHRTAAAKARGDTELNCTVLTTGYDQLPMVDFDVGEAILAQDERLKRFTGRIVLNRQVKRLTVASEQIEAAAVERAAEHDANNGTSWL